VNHEDLHNVLATTPGQNTKDSKQNAKDYVAL